MTTSELSKRIRSYEDVTRSYLYKKLPVIIRVDGKSFHKLTSFLDKPCDLRFISVMDSTALVACHSFQCCKFAYLQSDEISFLLSDLDTPNTEMWFNGDIRKICSISAATVSVSFTRIFNGVITPVVDGVFDSKVFNLPIYEVENYFIERQKDAVRNSIQGYAQSFFSHKQLYKLSCKQLQEKMFTDRKFNWDKIDTSSKRGRCVIKNSDGNWIVDNEIPIFTQDREYIRSRMVIGV
jgi:tRNA(His) 5'-end guanylyltransferase